MWSLKGGRKKGGAVKPLSPELTMKRLLLILTTVALLDSGILRSSDGEVESAVDHGG
jgi:hypothetical protein